MMRLFRVPSSIESPYNKILKKHTEKIVNIDSYFRQNIRYLSKEKCSLLIKIFDNFADFCEMRGTSPYPLWLYHYLGGAGS